MEGQSPTQGCFPFLDCSFGEDSHDSCCKVLILDRCYMCKRAGETVDHLLLHCATILSTHTHTQYVYQCHAWFSPKVGPKMLLPFSLHTHIFVLFNKNPSRLLNMYAAQYLRYLYSVFYPLGCPPCCLIPHSSTDLAKEN